MARDFVGGERGQLYLMPPSLLEWLPEEHLVWTVLGAVDHMDLGRFREGYRPGGAGRPAYEPSMMG
jgi:hypothetical protein